MPSILIVDDDQLVPRALARMFRSNGYVVRVLDDPAKAVAEIEAAPVDALITDYWMPGMTGLGLLTDVRERFPKVLRLLCSAMPHDVGPLSADLVQGFFTKPWENAAVLALVRGLLQGQAARG